MGFSILSRGSRSDVQLLPSVRASLDRGQPKAARCPVHRLPSAGEREKRPAMTGYVSLEEAFPEPAEN